jgi:hypothetical protein
MKILCYDLPCGAAVEAVKASQHELAGYLPRKQKADDPRAFSVTDKLFPTLTRVPKADVLLTCANYKDAHIVKEIVKQSQVSFIVWAVSSEPEVTRKALNQYAIPLQMLDYETTVLKGVSVHTLGYSYVEDRTFILATNDKRDLLPPKLKMLYPDLTLSDLCDTSSDAVFVRVDGNKQVFCGEPRPWTYTSIPRDEFHLEAHRLGPKLGTVLYLIGDKVHRLTPSEACVAVGNPDDFGDRVSPHCETAGQAVFAILSEPGMPVWLDLIERIAYESDKSK